MDPPSTASEGRSPYIHPIPPSLEFPYPRPPPGRSTEFSDTHTRPPHTSEPRTKAFAAIDVPPSTTASSTFGQSEHRIPDPLPPPSSASVHPRPHDRHTVPAKASNTTAARGSESSEGNRPSGFWRTQTGGSRMNMNQRINGPGRHKSSMNPFSKFSLGNEQFRTHGQVSKRDGRLNISVNETANSGYLAKALGATLHNHFHSDHRKPDDETTGTRPLSPVRMVGKTPYHHHHLEKTVTLGSEFEKLPVPKLNIVVMVIGSRGDIQPFLKLGKSLKEEHGHRVRIATHPAFKDFVEQDSGLEFFSVGGDPAELMAFMVKNPGLVPSIETVKAGEIGRKRDSMYEMFQGFWRACINATDKETNAANAKMMGLSNPFVADAIIANPPSFAHVHCAERLGIPLHLVFTFPYSPTQAFPHPLANIKQSNVDAHYTNFMSYPLVEMMTWQGLGDLVNRFRVKTLGLEPVSTLWAPGQLWRLKVPFTYLWSPGLVPKPSDWGSEIDIAGFVFLDLASNFKPPSSLIEFMKSGEPPVFIGFGSIVIDDPDGFTSMIFEAVKKAGVKALVNKGWGGLGAKGQVPDNVYMLENTPHDWLFPRVSAVVHHGGAGTTAIGLKCGKPTMIVPFFGDQPFWGAMVAKAGAGADPIPYKNLTADKLAEGIKKCLSPVAKVCAEEIARSIAEEGDGAENAVQSFHNHLSLRGPHSMRCSVLEDRVAVWTLKKTRMRLSALTAHILVDQRRMKWSDLRLLRHFDWNDFEGPGEPLTGGGAAIASTLGGIVAGVGGTPVRWAKSIKKKERQDKEKKQNRRLGHRRKILSKEKGNGIVDGNESHGVQPASNSLRYSDNDRDDFSDTSDSSENELVHDIVHDAGVGLAKSGEALAKAPMEISLALAQGFHNAPRLYGDTTVRTPTRISGIQSGLRAAGEEFVFGIYDGFSGLALHPYYGAKEGPIGFVKGVGKGIGGFVLKDISAVIGPFGYTMKGIHKELVKNKEPNYFIRKARIIEGSMDMDALGVGEKRERTLDAVNQAWDLVLEMRQDTQKAKQEGLKERVKLWNEKRRWGREGKFENVHSVQKAMDSKRRSKAQKSSPDNDDESEQPIKVAEPPLTNSSKNDVSKKNQGVTREARGDAQNTNMFADFLKSTRSKDELESFSRKLSDRENPGNGSRADSGTGS